MLLDERYAKGVDKKAHDIVIAWIEEMMRDDEMLPSLSKMLHRLYITETVEPDGSVQRLEPLLISNNEVESLLMEVVKTYLANHEEVTALDVLSEKGALACIFGNCCVTVKDAMATENYCHYKQVAFDVVTAHFATKEEKPTREAYERALGAMFSMETPVFDDPVDEDAYWDYAGEAYDNKMQEYFGSRYDAKEGSPLEVFKLRCFDGGEEDALKVAETE